MTGNARDDAEALEEPPLEPRKALQSGVSEPKAETVPPSSGARAVSPRPTAVASDRPGLSEPPASSEVVRRGSLAVGCVVAGKYRLERLLRKGGMGSVWVATHLGLDTPVAIKFMTAQMLEAPMVGEQSADLAATRAARFEREAKAAAQIRMANVVQVLDYGLDGALPYIVMELLEGEDLGARIAREGRLSAEALAQILTPTARALQRAHDAGLVHRDLKPENIFLAREGDEVIPKILDFGVAKALCGDRRRIRGSGDGDSAECSTSEGTVIGSPHYMSPEQALGRTDIDHRSDLWALGVIAFRALTGRLPFNSDVLLEAVLEICSAPIPRATALAPDLSPEVDRFFERALAREPRERFQSAKELAAALAELGAARPSSSLWRRPGQRTVLVIAAVVIVALVAAIAAVSWTSDPGAPAGRETGRAPAVEQPARGDRAEPPVTAPPATAPSPPATAPITTTAPSPTASMTTTAGSPREAPPPLRSNEPKKTTAPGTAKSRKEMPRGKSPSYDLGY